MTKDGAATLPGVLDLDPSTLEITYRLPLAGDVDGNGTIDTADQRRVVRGITEPGVHQRSFPQQDSGATLDVNADGDINFVELIDVITRIRDAS